jgi:hypothetical protein
VYARPGASHLVIHDLRTGHETWLLHVPPWTTDSAWAEDSKTVFVDVDVTGSSELWSFPIDGGAGKRLLTVLTPVDMGRLSSGPGGLLAAEYNTQRLNLATLSAAGTPEVIDPANYVTWSPAFAPDGTLAMGSDRGRAGDLADGAGRAASAAPQRLRAVLHHLVAEWGQLRLFDQRWVSKRPHRHRRRRADCPYTDSRDQCRSTRLDGRRPLSRAPG